MSRANANANALAERDRLHASWAAAVRTSVAVDGLELTLSRWSAQGKRRGAVLLIHGASASSDTFLVPRGGLAGYLVRTGWEVWTLDWRGSCRVVDRLVEGDEQPLHLILEERALFNLDRASEVDIPRALAEMRRQLGSTVPIAVVAHCFGAGALAIALARGMVAPFDVRNVVLSTLGLFYRAPWDCWLKAEDLLMERIVANTPLCRGITSRRADGWPPDLAKAYDRWPKSWLPTGALPADGMLARLCFMFGQPYCPDRLAPGIHGPLLDHLFGTMHFGLYLHAAQLVRRGHAAPLDPPRDRGAAANDARAHYLNPGPFADTRVTLLTGARNRLWHRDAIDTMYEWLLAYAWQRQPNLRPTKHVLRDYAHQDLLWGARADEEVYPLIARGIGASA